MLGLPEFASLGSYATLLYFASNFIYSKFVFTESYWSPSQISPQAVSTDFSDGGNVADKGLISFLTRKIENILVVLTSSISLQPASVWNVTDDPRKIKMVTNDLASYFGAFSIDSA